MTSIQNSKVNMYRVVIAVCNQNTGIVSAIPALQTACTAFAAMVDTIVPIAQQRSKIISGITSSKGSIRKTLIQQAAEIAANVFAYAFAKGDEALQEQVSFSVTSLGRHSDEDLVVACMNIGDAVTANLSTLSAFNITAATVTNLNSLLDQFRSEASQPRIAITNRAAHGQTLDNAFVEADTYLRYQLDKIVLSLTSTQPAFVSAYNAARIIVNPRTTYTQVKGKIRNQTTGLTVTGATVELLTTAITATSGRTGTYTLKPVPAGVFAIKVSKDGYVQKTIAGQTIKLGNVNTINIELTPTQE